MRRLLWLALFFALPAFAQQPLDPRPNPNVTLLDTYALTPAHMPDFINIAGLPAPLIERMNAGESWFNIEPCRNQWAFNGAGNFYGSLSAWVPASKNVGSQIVWTMTAPPLWATTAAGIAKTSCTSGTDNIKQNPGPKPADSYYNEDSTGTTISTYANETCKTVNALGTSGGGDTPKGDGAGGWSHGDCTIKELATAIMQETCHINHRPKSPMLGCDIHYFEGQNEWDVNQQWGQTSGSLNALAATQSDFAHVVKLYCADCYFFAGSASCGGNQYFGHCDAGTKLLLDAWHAVDPTENPDGVSIHDYNGTENVYPQAMPESQVSGDGTGSGGTAFTTNGAGGSSLCPATGQSPANRYCKSEILIVHDVRAALNAEPWLVAGAPIIGTESGPYYNDQEWDTGHANPLSGETTYSPGLSRAYVIRHTLVNADFHNPLFGTGGGMMTHDWYETDNTTPDCFGVEYLGSAYANIGSGCQRSGHSFTLPAGITPYGVGHKTVSQWLNLIDHFTVHIGDVFGGNTGWNEVWSGTAAVKASSQAVYGPSVQFLWDTGWERQQTRVTSYTKYLDGQGNVHTVGGGTVRFGPEPIMLYGLTGGGTVQPVPGTYTSGTVAASTTVVGTLAQGYLGLAYAKSKLWAGTRFFVSSNARGVADFKAVGAGTLRLTTGDSEVWTPGGAGQTAGQIAPSDLTALAGFLTATGWKCTYGIRFLGSSTSAAATEATAVAAALGANLVAFEIGNEPDGSGYSGYTASSFASAWRTYALAIKGAVPSAKFVGPSTGIPSNVGTYNAAMMSTNADLILWDTSHYYVDGPSTATQAEMLAWTSANAYWSSGSNSMATIRATHPAPWVLNETGDVYSGGLDGVSNTFSSALFALDFPFEAAISGVSMVNFISGGMGTAPSNPYSVIQDSNGYTYLEQPKFAGLLLFELATKGQAGSLLSTAISAGGATAYTIQNSDGTFSTVIVNRSTANLGITLSLYQPIASATILTLADSAGLADKTPANVLIQGSPLGNTPPVPGTPYIAPIASGAATVYVPTDSAVLVNSIPAPVVTISGFHPHGRRQHSLFN